VGIFPVSIHDSGVLSVRNCRVGFRRVGFFHGTNIDILNLYVDGASQVRDPVALTPRRVGRSQCPFGSAGEELPQKTHYKRNLLTIPEQPQGLAEHHFGITARSYTCSLFCTEAYAII
jgi:hypothetical protein